MPDNAEELWQQASTDSAPKLPDVHFTVLALGDTSYEFFCESGKDWDQRFEELGATRLVERVDCDVDYDSAAPLGRWTHWLPWLRSMAMGCSTRTRLRQSRITPVAQQQQSQLARTDS